MHGSPSYNQESRQDSFYVDVDLNLLPRDGSSDQARRIGGRVENLCASFVPQPVVHTKSAQVDRAARQYLSTPLG